MRAVVTGGPSVGKTTIISLLAERGFRVVSEFATQIIREGVFLPWVDRATFQQEVLKRQMKAEAELSGVPEPVFLDRGLFDGEAYYIYDRIQIPDTFQSLSADHYSVAFLVEPLAFFEANSVRRENLEFTLELTRILADCYERRGVKVVKVPALPPNERVDFVLASCHSLFATAKAANLTSSTEQPSQTPMCTDEPAFSTA